MRRLPRRRPRAAGEEEDPRRQKKEECGTCGVGHPRCCRFSAGGVPARFRSQLPDCARRTRPAIISLPSTKLYRQERHSHLKRREVFAGSARATFAPPHLEHRAGGVPPMGVGQGGNTSFALPGFPRRRTNGGHSGDPSASCPSCRAGGTPGSVIRTGVWCAVMCIFSGTPHHAPVQCRFVSTSCSIKTQVASFRQGVPESPFSPSA